MVRQIIANIPSDMEDKIEGLLKLVKYIPEIRRTSRRDEGEMIVLIFYCQDNKVSKIRSFLPLFILGVNK